MIDLVLTIPDIGWTVFFHVAVSCYHTDKIVRELSSLGAPDKYVRKAEKLLSNCILDEGLTYTNKAYREGVVVIELTSSAGEFLNSLEHEIRHLVDSIAIAEDMYYEEETLCYLTGAINRQLYPYVKKYLCEECRSKLT